MLFERYQRSSELSSSLPRTGKDQFALRKFFSIVLFAPLQLTGVAVDDINISSIRRHGAQTASSKDFEET